MKLWVRSFLIWKLKWSDVRSVDFWRSEKVAVGVKRRARRMAAWVS